MLHQSTPVSLVLSQTAAHILHSRAVGANSTQCYLKQVPGPFLGKICSKPVRSMHLYYLLSFADLVHFQNKLFKVESHKRYKHGISGFGTRMVHTHSVPSNGFNKGRAAWFFLLFLQIIMRSRLVFPCFSFTMGYSDFPIPWLWLFMLLHNP